MPNGPDDPFPFPPPFFPPPIPIGPFIRRRRRRRFRRVGPRPGFRRGGVPAIVIPLPVPEPTQPVRPPVSFPTTPAANDPVFSRAAKFIKIGSVIVTVAAVIDFLVREAQERTINREQREREQVDRQVARRLGAGKPPRVVEIAPPAAPPRPTIFETIPDIGVENIPQLPQNLPSPVEIPTPGRVPLEVPLPTPGQVTIPAPGLPAPSPSPIGVPAPVSIPGIGSPTPVFIPRTRPFSFPIFSPVGFPVFDPVSFPRRVPIGDPLTPITPPDVASPIQPGSIELPQTQPQPQNRRCPAPRRKKKKRRTKRDKCFKGLFREGPFDDQVTFKKWVQIDCSSGRELGKKKRPTGTPRLRSV